MHRSPSQLTFFRWSTAFPAVVSCPRTLFFRQKNLTVDKKISRSLEQLILFRLQYANTTICGQHLPESSVSIHIRPIYLRTVISPRVYSPPPPPPDYRPFVFIFHTFTFSHFYLPFCRTSSVCHSPTHLRPSVSLFLPRHITLSISCPNLLEIIKPQ